MEISGASLDALFTGFNVIFNQAFEDYPSYFQDIATRTSSTTRQESYPWLKRTPGLREWIGERTIQALETNLFSIVNRAFESTLEIDKFDLQDDRQGVYEPMVSELGRLVKVHPDVLIFGMLKAALANPDTPSAAALDFDGISFSVPVCWDNTTLFSVTGHPVGPSGNTSLVSNINTGGGSNPYWILLDASRAVRPVIYQMRNPFEAVYMNSPTDEWVFNQHTYRYGVEGRDAVGPGLWQLTYASNMDLSNAVNYDNARVAMRQIKNDNGLPFGAWGASSASKHQRYLIVPPALEGAGLRLLTAEFAAGEGTNAATPTTNIWRGDAQLIVSEYLE